MTQLNAKTFWDTNLEDVEGVFLSKKQKIVDLPIALDNRVPPQGSVLLNRSVNIKKVVKEPSIAQRIYCFFCK